MEIPRKLALIQLNEINFDLVKHYTDLGIKLPNLKKVYDARQITVEHEEYGNLEPWIQWFSLFTGQPYKQHQVFRLGDGHLTNNSNFFTDLTKSDISVGAISPMNISKDSANFKFFLPDPWSSETAVGSVFLKFISEAVSQGVNDNTGGGLNFKNKAKLLIGLFRYLRFKDLREIFNMYSEINGKSYRKALFLDLVLVKLHHALDKSYSVKFSSIFLNAGAHIQHHYFLNSSFAQKENMKKNPEWYISQKEDPVLESLIFYDFVLSQYKKYGYKIMLATGLQQVPYLENTFYYRLNDHDNFFKFFELPYLKINPRMTRDFEVEFRSASEKMRVVSALSSFLIDGKKLFGDITDSGDHGDNKIFCTLTYDDEIKIGTVVAYQGKEIDLYKSVNFVAVKNGMHDKYGIFFNDIISKNRPFSDVLEVTKLREIITKSVKDVSK